jgi:hypothetical protein
VEPVSEDVDRWHTEIVAVGENAAAIATLMADREPTDSVMLALLRRALPKRFLEYVARTEPWASRPLVLTAVVTNPRVDTALSLRLLPQLTWRSLATVSATPWVNGMVKTRADALLTEMLPDLKLGERIALGRIAGRSIAARLLADPDAKVLEATLENPRLMPDDLLRAISRDAPPRELLESVSAATRWREFYAVRLALVLQPRTPLALALAQLSALTPRDLSRVAANESLTPLVCKAAERVLADRQR